MFSRVAAPIRSVNRRNPSTNTSVDPPGDGRRQDPRFNAFATRTCFICSTAWLVFLSSALIRSGAFGEARIFIFAKGDNPGLRAAASIGEVAGVRCEPIGFALLDKRLNQLVEPMDVVIPGRLRRRIDIDIAPFFRTLHTFDPDLVIVGNRFHAPERAVLATAKRCGRSVGLLEEGLSIYQQDPYWSRPRDIFLRLLHHWAGVADLYGTDVHAASDFDLAFLCDPSASVPFTARRRLELGLFAHDLKALSGAAVSASPMSALGSELRDGDGLVLSQRLSEDGLCKLDEELAALAEAIRRLPAVRRVWFKAHPRDRYDKLPRLANRLPTVEIVPLVLGPLPIEVVLSNWRPRWILGFLSGTLVYARIIYGLPTFSAVNLIRARPSLDKFRATLEVIQPILRPVLI